ncbi:MAG: restriction endonuclease subunit S [Bacteroidaceae bacterium]|nr:restriction endonuclease subunit S [Bacteroidaceae bacterium]
MEEWKEYKLEEVVNILDYKRIPLSSKERSTRKGNYPYYGAQGIIDYIDDYIFDGTYLLIAEDGENLKSQKQNVAQLASGKYWVNNHAHIVESNGKSDIRYICYLLNMMDLSGYITGSAQPKLNQANLTSISLQLPSLESQKRVADFLSIFDDKIEVNRRINDNFNYSLLIEFVVIWLLYIRINDNLEQQAQALFKSWFVDFEPFKDGEFVESELGMIPKGWKVISLEDIIKISKKTVNPGKYPDIQFAHYSIPAYDNGMNPEVQLGKEILSNKFTIMDKMTLFSKLNPRIKRVWFIDNVLNESICSTEFVPYIAKNTLFSSYVYSLINSDGFYEFVMSLVNGATGSHQRFHPNETLSYMIPFNDEIVLKYSHIVNPILTHILNNREESSRLAELRDSLLPRLMSGELKVNDVE